MASCYGMGVFNDNFFRQATLLLAVRAGQNWYPGTAMVLFALPYLLFSAPAGWLADRFPKRRVVIGAKALELAAMICGAAGVLTGSWALMLAMVCLMGTQSAIFNPSLNGTIPELYPDNLVNSVNARLRVAATGAILLGVAFAGEALEAGDGAGHPSGTAGRTVVAVVILAVALAGLATAFGIPYRKAADERVSFPWTGTWDTLKDLRHIIINDPFLTLAIGTITLVFFLGAVKILTVNELAIRQYGTGEAAASRMIFTATMGVAAGGLLSTPLVKRFKWHFLMLPAAGCIAAVFCVIALAPLLPAAAQLPVIFSMLGLAGIIGGLMVIPAQAFVQVRPRPQQRGAVIAACNFAVFSGILLSGPAGWALLRKVPPTSVFEALAVLSLTAIALLTWRTCSRNGGGFFNRVAAAFTRLSLHLRYRIEIKGLKEIESRGRSGIVFLPNHPALIDPVILLALLHGRFNPRVWAVEHQVDRPVIKQLARRLGVLTFPAVGRDPEKARRIVQQHIKTTVDALGEGSNFMLYPSGHAYRTGKEDLRGNSAAHSVVRQAADARVVLVRTTGLWGSSFSWAYGYAPRIGNILKKAIKDTLKNFIFFTPRRHITIEFIEPDDLPRSAGREELNRYMEEFYNRKAHPPLYVPYTIWEKGGNRVMEEPQTARTNIEGADSVPPEVAEKVRQHLREISGTDEIRPENYLGRDLGIDSIGRAELLSWLQSEFGVSGGNAESVRTAADLMMAASGRAPLDEPAEIKEPAAKWFSRKDSSRISIGAGGTINEAFIEAAKNYPARPAAADQVSGTLSYRRILTAIHALRPHIDALPGRRIGIMLPASAGAGVVYMAVLFAGKTPVMLNWTLGGRNLKHCLKAAEVETVLTARALTDRLQSLGTDLSDLSGYLTYLSDIRQRIGAVAKISAALRARFMTGRIPGGPPDPEDTAVILFTSGSENFPKAVPLTHKNILSNISDITKVITVRANDCLLGMLPPFHSFGLTVTLVLPLCTGVRTVFYPDPTDGGTLAQIIDTYRVNLLVGTPTFLDGILKSPAPASLSSLRIAVTGAEECPEETYNAIQQRCPGAVILEGYGITECSPVVSVNDENAPIWQTIGRPLPSFEYAIVDVDSRQRVKTGMRGMLLLRGPCVFGGYMSDKGQSKNPFVEFEGKKWYETGDLVIEKEEGVLKFCGRLKRFVKIGGEMISLPAIEAELKARYDADEGDPRIAVTAAENGGQTRIVLFSTRRDIDRRAANASIREAGLSPLHSIKEVVYVDAIPVLGTGKTDYRTLQEKLV